MYADARRCEFFAKIALSAAITTVAAYIQPPAAIKGVKCWPSRRISFISKVLPVRSISGKRIPRVLLKSLASGRDIRPAVFRSGSGRDRWGMGSTSAADAFGDALFELYEAAGCPPLARLAALGSRTAPKITLTTSSLNDWFNGKSVPSNPAAVRLLVIFLGERITENGSRRDSLRPVNWWLDLRELAWNETHIRRGGRPRKPQEAPEVGVRIDEKRRLTRRVGGQVLTYGTMLVEPDRVAHGEGVVLRASAHSRLPHTVFITNIDLLASANHGNGA
ncbi:hypothetical protein ACQPW1_30300 [Nocardia sp. CA-128927]|uniref:hypothetical protein n=1 Tax=Nocardia sp. CA-128927 TaxID=3239975 RepID=UPI003D956990